MFSKLFHWLGQRLVQYLDEPILGYQSFSTTTAADLRPCIQPGDVLLVDGNLRISLAIKYLTQSTWSHAAIYVGSDAGLTDEYGNPAELIEADAGKGVIAVSLNKYDGLIWGGSSLNIYNDTPEIRRQISFMKECFKNINNILAICWGMQVAVTAAGGKVDPGKNGAHIGIASDVIINNEGQKHFIYKDKKKIFTSPAFNFDEVSELPKNTILLSSDKVNNVMGISFNAGNSEIIGLQYHPDYEYFQMINLIAGRKERLFKNKNFLNDEEYQNHISNIKVESELLNFKDRTCEVRNWLNYIKN